MEDQDRQFMPQATAEERLRIMNDNFDRVKESYTKILNDDEKLETDAEVSKLITTIDALEDDLAAYTKPKKDEIKQLKTTRRQISVVAKFGQIDIEAELFIMKDFHQKMAYLRDDNGMLVKVRPLSSDELQGNLL